MPFEQTLRELGEHYGLTGLALDETGSCALLLDGRQRVEIEHRPERGAIYLRLLLGLPALDEAAIGALLRRLLEACLLGEATFGAVFAIDEDDRLSLQRRVVLRQGLRVSSLAAALEDLYGVARHVTTELGLDPG